MSGFVKAADAAGFAPGEIRPVSVNGKQILLTVQDGACFAFDRNCPHKATPLDHGTACEGKIYCPMHGWGFDLATGACDTNPDKPLKTYPARIMDGEIQVLLS